MSSEKQYCERCKKQITTVAVFALNSVYHAECLTCDQCRSVIDQSYVEIGGEKLCEKCASEKTVCAKCSKAITGPYLDVRGESYHAKCLTCDDCRSSIESNYTEHNGKRLCDDCAGKKLVCSKCRKVIVGSYIELDQGKLIHIDCMEPEECFKCKKNISYSESNIQALGKSWHQKCFSCTKCGTQLSGTFYSKDSQPFCQSCSTQAMTAGTCISCSRTIRDSPFIRYRENMYHEDCFTCSSCKSRLDPSSFFSFNGSPVCSNCKDKPLKA